MTDKSPATPDLPLTQPFRVSALPARTPTRFNLTPDPATQAQVAVLLGISGVKGLTFKGEIRSTGRHDFVLEAKLSATVIQPCGISLAPVTTKILETVTRRYLADFVLPDGDEIEMPEDDSQEPMPEVIDAGAVAVEALALALPLYPRAPGAELGEAVHTEPGTAPLRDTDLRPFAGLAGLRDKLGGTSGTGEG
jgi:uncharacterized metal-binding protein YceD (DUF177 family)